MHNAGKQALQKVVMLLFQWFLDEVNVIYPDGAFAIDNDVQSDPFGALSWLKEEWCLKCAPIHRTGNHRIHTSGEILAATDADFYCVK